MSTKQEKQLAYRLAHRQELREKNRAYSASHREQIRARSRARHIGETREKRLIYAAQYREAHREELRAKSAIYRAAHLEKIRASYHANPEPIRIKAAEHYAANRQEKLLYQKEYAQTHPEQVRGYKRAWEHNNPEKKLANTQRRRARKANASVNDLTATQWREIKAAYGHQCVYQASPGCRGRIMKNLTQDHLTPLSKGGHHTASNIVPACGACNSKKHVNAPLTPVQPLLLTVAPSRKETT